MTWVRLADDFTDHPKVVRAGPLAAWLYVCGLVYANRYATDGYVPGAQVPRLADVADPLRLAERLVMVGLWEVSEDGYVIHDYGAYQPSSDEVKQERSEAARRQAEYRRRRADARNAARNGVLEPCGPPHHGRSTAEISTASTSPPTASASPRHNAEHNALQGVMCESQGDSRAPDTRATGAPAPGPARPGPVNVKPGPGSTTIPTLPPPAEEGTAGMMLARDVVERLAALPDDLTAKAFHDQAEQALALIGFRCSREVVVDNRGDGQRGRLDLVAERGAERLALELDDRSPRQKSVTKLAGVLGGTVRVVVLRCPADGPLPHPDGVDVVIGAGRRPDDCPGSPPPPLSPLAPEDALLWAKAREQLRADMNPANWDHLIEPLQPLGRAPDGGLYLRAPPGSGIARRVGTVVRRALFDEGDREAVQSTIVET